MCDFLYLLFFYFSFLFSILINLLHNWKKLDWHMEFRRCCEGGAEVKQLMVLFTMQPQAPA